MSHSSYRLYCQCIDPSRNMARYYALSIELDLFGAIAVVRRWGRIGTSGGEKHEPFETERGAIEHFLALARGKIRRGYRPVGRSEQTR